MNGWNTRLRNIRKQKKISLKEAAITANLTQQALIAYENGRVNPKVEYLLKLCDFYGVTLNYIIYGNDNALTLENCLQKNIETFFTLYTSNKITYDSSSSTFKIEDNNLKRYIDFLIDFLKDHSKDDISTLEHIIHFIKNIKE